LHTGTQLQSESLAIEINGAVATLGTLLPDGHRQDRFGIVVTQPLGSLGASLLMQAAIAHWFESCPQRRYVSPVYPEIYCFHLGGPHGDHSFYDFWPPRKEVFLAEDDAAGLLAEINARAITRLAIPDREPGEGRALTVGPSTWAEQASAEDRLRSCWAYSPCGEAPEADIRMSTDDPRFEENPAGSLNLGSVTDDVMAQETNAFAGYLPGLSVPADNYRWVHAVRQRTQELTERQLAMLRKQRERASGLGGRLRTEAYRSLDTESALLMLAAWGSTVD
jgi:hypothetical protein